MDAVSKQTRVYIPGEMLAGCKAGWQAAVDRLEAAVVGLGGALSWVGGSWTVMTRWVAVVGR